jgi:hypothetical protein
MNAKSARTERLNVREVVAAVLWSTDCLWFAVVRQFQQVVNRKQLLVGYGGGFRG